MLLFKLYILSLPFTFAACLYAYKSLDNSFKPFLPYFTFVIVYVTADFFNLLIINHSNAWSNNFENILDFTMFAYFIISQDKRLFYKRKAYILGGVVILLSFVDIFFIQGFWHRATIAIVLQGLFILTLVCIYYYNLLEEASEHLFLLRHPPFLVATGLLFYFLSLTFYYSFFSYMLYKNTYHFVILAATILGIANLMLNAILIYAFLCSVKNKGIKG
ncbi:hypothetical protein SAMN05428947_112156 [Mucilaginibacter sp. OK283]|jgi:hypothetical protein|nr:hypothetical protein SAMN05428947_112156 [Mucilaginibacter sp. OK283]